MTFDTDEYVERSGVLFQEDEEQGLPLFNARMREWPDGRIQLLITPHESVIGDMDFNVDGEPATGFIVETDKQWSSLKFSVQDE